MKKVAVADFVLFGSLFPFLVGRADRNVLVEEEVSRPVRAGDIFSARFTVLTARVSASKPDRGLVRTLIELSNQAGELVMSQVMMNLILRREA